MSGSGFSEAERSALTALLDEIIPRSPDGRLPGAGELGLAAAIDETLRKAPEGRPALLQGLHRLDELAQARGAESFAELDRSGRLALMDELAARDPGFVPGLLFPTYASYYQSPRVVEALGMEARPPHPKGYEIGPHDPKLLDPVRARGRMYRDV